MIYLLLFKINRLGFYVKKIGVLEWYSEEKCYGVISTTDFKLDTKNDQEKLTSTERYNEVFIHVKNWIDKTPIDFKNNQSPFVFDVAFERGKVIAKKCRYFNYSIEDFELLFELTIHNNGMLKIKSKTNHNPLKIVDIIFNQSPSSCTYFDKILENKLVNIDNTYFFSYLEMLYQYFNQANVLRSQEIINKDIETRMKENTDSIFAFEACKYEYTNIEKLKFVDIQKNIEKIDLDFYIRLKSHPEISEISRFILLDSKEQSLLETIICDLENILASEFDFQRLLEVVHNNFLNFSPENQVLFMKKFFHLNALSKIQFTADDMGIFLNESILNEINSHNKYVDVSTLLIADILRKFAHRGKFIAEKELINTVLNSIGYDKSRKIQIEHYFDKCNGITRLKISKDINGTINKEKFITSNGQKKYYFKVSCSHEQDIVDSISKIEGAKYNRDGSYWGVPLKCEQEIITFAKTHKMFIESENSFKDNFHLLEFYTDEKNKPIDIAFCAGVEAKEADANTEKKFWWCAGGKCYQNNILLHTTDDWKNYTLYDFVSILGLSLEENNAVTSFPIGLYIQFVTILNRFQKLLEKMYCTECKHILYPVETSIASAYSVVKFSCENQQCSSHRKVIYLNHCLNGQCNAIIDSRESEKCSNGLYICHTCGSCCSHAMFERRRDNLSKNNISVPADLTQKIHNKAGHLEKSEYFCYKCGQWMEELSAVSYQCKDCDVHYDLSKYPYLKKIRINHELRDVNYPVVSLNHSIQKFKRILLDEKQSLEANGRTQGQIFGIIFNKIIEIDGNEISLKILNNKNITNEIFS